ncbi:MAG: hypothetical protein ACRCTZ_02470 [Sarcina sp.]
MKIIKIIFISILFTLLASTTTFASEIILDGNFSDWSDKAGIDDPSGDSLTNPDEDLKAMKYYSDGENLYLYFERYSANNPFWDIQVIFFNGTGNLGSHYTPWDNPKENFAWKSVNATTAKINVSKSSSSSDPLLITTNFDGSFNSASFDGRQIEFSIPLSAVGLIGKEIQFAAKSDPSSDAPKIDWIPENGPIYVTDGPIFGSLSTFLIILTFIKVSYLATKHNRINL